MQIQSVTLVYTMFSYLIQVKSLISRGTTCALRTEVSHSQRSRHHRMGQQMTGSLRAMPLYPIDTTPPMDASVSTSSQQSGQAKQNAPMESDYHAPAVSEAVVRMPHHMSRIFEDSSKMDQIHRGLQIDRKRRQELQRKRLAMGYKPDDHEEQTFG